MWNFALKYARSFIPLNMAQTLDSSVIGKVMARGAQKAKHSWEYGAASEALIQLYNPELSVFGPNPFPGGSLPKLDGDKVQSLMYARKFIETNASILIDGDGTLCFLISNTRWRNEESSHPTLTIKENTDISTVQVRLEIRLPLVFTLR